MAASTSLHNGGDIDISHTTILTLTWTPASHIHTQTMLVHIYNAYTDINRHDGHFVIHTEMVTDID